MDVRKAPEPSILKIGDVSLRSRLIVGTGKYTSNEIMVDAIRASGAEMVTVAVRRVDLDRTKEEAILHHLDPKEFFLLANTAGCYTGEDALVMVLTGDPSPPVSDLCFQSELMAPIE